MNGSGSVRQNVNGIDSVNSCDRVERIVKLSLVGVARGVNATWQS